MSAPCRWSDLKNTFGMRMYILPDILREALEIFGTEHAHLIERFRANLMNDRADMYDEEIHSNGAPFERCVGFMNSTKIQMQRLGGPEVLQSSVYILDIIVSIAFYIKRYQHLMV